MKTARLIDGVRLPMHTRFQTQATIWRNSKNESKKNVFFSVNEINGNANGKQKCVYFSIAAAAARNISCSTTITVHILLLLLMRDVSFESLYTWSTYKLQICARRYRTTTGRRAVYCCSITCALKWSSDIYKSRIRHKYQLYLLYDTQRVVIVCTVV